MLVDRWTRVQSREEELRRVGILRRLNLLDTPPERMIDDLVLVASRLLDAPIAAVTLIDESRQWFKSAVGIDVVETPRSIAFCDHTIRGSGPFVVADATADHRFDTNPLVVGAPHVRAYAGVPLHIGGAHVGALCVVDTHPREFDPRAIETLAALGRVVERTFELRWRRLMSTPLTQAYVAHLASTLNSIDDFYTELPRELRPTCLFDPGSMRFLAVNDSFVEQYGWTREQCLGLHISHILPDDEMPALQALLDDPGLMDNSPTMRSWRHKRADGSELNVQATYAVTTGPVKALLVVMTDVTVRDQGRAALIHAATHDQLTDLPNRMHFNRCVSDLIRADPGRALALLFVDLDGFKLVNDTAGHAVGDLVLAATARRIAGSIRGSDQLARIGGDEFAIVCDGTTIEGARELAARVCESLKEPLVVDERRHHLSASIGIALNRADSTAEELLIEADLAMLAAKQSGRARIAVFDQALRTSIARRASIEHDLHLALERGEFELYYQPILGLTSNDIHVEALLRWNHPTQGVLAPGEFLSVAELSGLILPIGSMVLRAAAAASIRLNTGARRIRVAFNVATQQLRPSFVEEVECALAETGADARHLIAEVTESGMITREASVVTRALQDLGLAISIDDFGTGYSSLGRLRELRVDALKLDRSFITDLTKPQDRRMITTIVQLARTIDVPVVAEGVETAEQLLAVTELGCHYAQGFVYARPMPETGLHQWLDAWAIRLDHRRPDLTTNWPAR